jgi:uncharacterized protein (DUF362 family)
VFGADWVAVDATCTRLMALDPARVEYLAAAGAFLGNLAEPRIEQVGERPGPLVRPFTVIESFAYLQAQRT